MHDEKAVHCILSVIAITVIHPLSPLQLMSISTGVLTTEKVASDMSSAKEKGEIAFYTFVKSRLSNEKTMCIFDPIKKMKLSTFSSMNKIKTCRVNLKIIPVQASTELFTKVSLVAQIRSLNMISVFKFPLGPLP